MIVEKPDLPYIINAMYNFFSSVSSIDSLMAISNTFTKIVYHTGDIKNENTQVPTLALDTESRLHINLNFWKKYVKQEADVGFLIGHELLHHVLGDITRLKSNKDVSPKEAELVNLAEDMRINSFLYYCLITSFNTRNNKYFITGDFYKPSGIMGLLRPQSMYPANSKFYKLYTDVWGSFSSEINNFDDLLKAIKIIINYKPPKIIYIGSHNLDFSNQGVDEEGNVIEADFGGLPKDIKEKLQKAFKDVAGKIRGLGTESASRVIEDIIIQESISKTILKTYSINSKLNKIKSFFPEIKKKRQPIPINPSKRDLYMMSIGHMPTIWNGTKTVKKEKNSGVAIYLDVSGSVTEYIPKILSILKKMRKNIDTIFCFSTEINEIKTTDLEKGIIRSTGGTDFSCIGHHVIDNNFKKCIIFTDGHASIDQNLKEPLKKVLKKAAIVLFENNNNRNNWFSDHYDTFYLRELIR